MIHCGASIEYGSIGQSSALDALDNEMVPQVKEDNVCNMYPEPKALKVTCCANEPSQHVLMPGFCTILII
jgi:hypothetical protein